MVFLVFSTSSRLYLRLIQDLTVHHSSAVLYLLRDQLNLNLRWSMPYSVFVGPFRTRVDPAPEAQLG